MPADAEQALLQLAVGGKPRGVDDAVDAAVDHDGDVLRHRGRDADVLLDDEDGDLALLAEPHQHVLDLGDDDRREALGRLVHDQEARIGQQRARDRQHLLLAAGELAAAVGLALGEPRESLVDALDRPGAAPLPATRRRCSSTRQRAPQPPALRHVADAEPGDPAGLQADQHPRRERGSSRRDARTRPMMALHSVVLPMPLRPTTDSTPCFERQVDALQRMRVAVVDVEAPDLEGRRAARRDASAMAASEVELLHLRVGSRSPAAGPP